MKFKALDHELLQLELTLTACYDDLRTVRSRLVESLIDFPVSSKIDFSSFPVLSKMKKQQFRFRRKDKF
jgi:hypothetical protein